MKPKILYEDQNILVLSKPAGLAVHGDQKNLKEKTVASFLIENFPKIKDRKSVV